MNDPEIRVALAAHLSLIYAQDPETLLVEELNVCGGASRMDVVAVGSSLHGYEIKSRVDNLSRLATQLKDYTAVFDRLTVVTGVNHLTGILKAIPNCCGVMLATRLGGAVVLETFRESEGNPHRERYALAQLLWREEALKVLIERGLARGVKSKPRPLIWSRLAETLGVEELSSEVCKAFKNRPANWRQSLRQS